MEPFCQKLRQCCLGHAYTRKDVLLRGAVALTNHRLGYRDETWDPDYSENACLRGLIGASVHKLWGEYGRSLDRGSGPQYSDHGSRHTRLGIFKDPMAILPYCSSLASLVAVHFELWEELVCLPKPRRHED